MISTTKSSIYFLLLIIYLVCLVSWKGLDLWSNAVFTKFEPILNREQTISKLWGEIQASKPRPITQPTQKEIENYVKVIFGKDSKVAIAVSHHECSPKNKQYPKCVAHTDKEYSVGLFQINLYNAKHWIHASKVPGKTMEEKAEWLKDPYQNTLIAYKIYSDSKGFNPWSAYTNKSYLGSLK